MSSDEFNIDSIIRKKLESFSKEPPSAVWEKIYTTIAIEKRRRKVLIMNWISVAAILLLALIGGWFIVSQKSAMQPQTAETEKIIQEKNEPSSQTPEKQAIEEIFGKSSNNNRPVGIQKNRVASQHQKNADTENQVIRRNAVITGEMKKIHPLIQTENEDLFLAEIPRTQKNTDLSDDDKSILAENAKAMLDSKDDEHNLKMGMFIAPGYSSQSVSHSDSYRKSMTNSDSDGNSNVGGGFSFQYKIGKKLGLESGVYYAQNGQKSNNGGSIFSIRNDKIYRDESGNAYYSNSIRLSGNNFLTNSNAGQIAMSEPPKGAEIVADLDNSLIAPTKSMLLNGEFTQVFDFIEIPLYVRYDLLDTQVGIQFLGGINAGFIIGNNAYIDNNFGLQNVGKTQDISTFNVSGTVGLGLSYDLTKHLSLAVEPRLNYYLNSINKSSEVDFRPYRIGIYSKLNYEF